MEQGLCQMLQKVCRLTFSQKGYAYFSEMNPGVEKLSFSGSTNRQEADFVAGIRIEVAGCRL